MCLPFWFPIVLLVPSFVHFPDQHVLKLTSQISRKYECHPIYKCIEILFQSKYLQNTIIKIYLSTTFTIFIRLQSVLCSHRIISVRTQSRLFNTTHTTYIFLCRRFFFKIRVFSFPIAFQTICPVFILTGLKIKLHNKSNIYKPSLLCRMFIFHENSKVRLVEAGNELDASGLHDFDQSLFNYSRFAGHCYVI